MVHWGQMEISERLGNRPKLAISDAEEERAISALKRVVPISDHQFMASSRRKQSTQSLQSFDSHTSKSNDDIAWTLVCPIGQGILKLWRCKAMELQQQQQQRQARRKISVSNNDIHKLIANTKMTEPLTKTPGNGFRKRSRSM